MKRKRLVALAMLLALLVSMLNPAAGARASAASVAYVFVMETYIDEEGSHFVGGETYQPTYGEYYSYTAPSTKYYNGREYDFIDISAPASGLSRTHNGVYTNSVEFSSVVINVTYELHTSPATPTPTKAPEKPSVTGSLTPTPAPAKMVLCDVTVKTKEGVVKYNRSLRLEVGTIKQIKYDCPPGYNEDGQWCSLDESIALWRQGYYEVTVPNDDFQIVFYVRKTKGDGCFIHVTTDFYENEELLKSIPQPVVEYTAAGMEEAGYWYSHNWYETRVYNGNTYYFYKSSAEGGDPARPATTGKKAPWMVSSGLKAGCDIDIMMAWNRNSGPTPTPTSTPTPTLTPTPTATPKPTATPTPKPKIIDLDGWWPDVHTDKQVEVEEGKKPRNVTPPIKHDYEFQGYYTEPEGNGTQYYDEDGKCIKEWDEPDMTDKLYADWKAAPPPVYDPYNPTLFYFIPD